MGHSTTCPTPSPLKGGEGGGAPAGGPREVGQTLYSLADRLRRLAPSSRYPDRFHEEKSEIAHALVELAREVRHG